MLLPSYATGGLVVNDGSGHRLTSRRTLAIFWVVTVNVFDTYPSFENVTLYVPAYMGRW